MRVPVAAKIAFAMAGVAQVDDLAHVDALRYE